jgi:hypothetical protein
VKKWVIEQVSCGKGKGLQAGRHSRRKAPAASISASGWSRWGECPQLASASKRVFGNQRRREQSVRSQGGGFAIDI